ncbi:MAG: FkbM family methyltransferase [Desulfobacterales bacterium]|nr:FkbM family methyltransferase [Desulfobacterales bacterium]
MKQIINTMLGKLGYELRRKNRASMSESLQWLSDNKFNIATVIDVGASNGCWSKKCMKFFPNSKYILFEPQPVHSNALDTFVSSCKQIVIPIRKAVGASVGKTLFNASDPFGGSLTEVHSNDTIEVKLTTIDNSISEIQAEPPYLLKLDTHGFEKSILEGASKSLKNCEVLIIEAYNYRITGEALLFWELCSFLSDRGFRPVDIVDVMHRFYDKSFWQMDMVFIRSSWKGFTYTSYT